MSETLRKLGEKKIINRLKRFVDIGQIDDDTAHINPKGKEVLINTDLLVEGVHFNDLTTYPEAIGWKAVATNLSDLAASGVDKILGITVGLVAPPDTPWRWVEGVYKGIDNCLNKFGGKVLGGDCSSGKEICISITAFGTLGHFRIHRANALPGDLVVTSGSHGFSRLGLALLLSEDIPGKEFITEALKAKAIEKHQLPTPALEASQALERCRPYGSSRIAGTDSSDGLIEALKSICESSGCQAVLNLSSGIPRSNDWPLGDHWDRWCLNGGEDYELVLSLPREWAKAWLKIVPSSHEIGFMKAGKANVIWEDNSEIRKDQFLEFQHFQKN